MAVQHRIPLIALPQSAANESAEVHANLAVAAMIGGIRGSSGSGAMPLHLGFLALPQVPMSPQTPARREVGQRASLALRGAVLQRLLWRSGFPKASCLWYWLAVEPAGQLLWHAFDTTMQLAVSAASEL